MQAANTQIGTLGIAWTKHECAQWLEQQSIQRSYENEIMSKLNPLMENFTIEQYGALNVNQQRYPLIVVKSKHWSHDKPTALITGGVHGYETSGVQGAIRFLETAAEHYSDSINLVVAPCVSPWAYETINRWNPDAIDPNRSFVANSMAQESADLMSMVSSLSTPIDLHIDLHETTDTDNTEFRPALAARDAVKHKVWDIPDGFYLVGDAANPCDEFQKAVIKSVGRVTHIAEADTNNKLIGEPISQFGVINYACKDLGLCTGFSNANLSTTTEVYPDSPLVDDENCVLAQVTAVTSALNFALTARS